MRTSAVAAVSFAGYLVLALGTATPVATAVTTFPQQNNPVKGVDFPCTAATFGTTYPWNDTNRRLVLHAMQTAGVEYIRINSVHWDKAELQDGRGWQDGQGQYLDLVKHCVSLITSYGMGVDLVVNDTPSWAGPTSLSPPNDCVSQSDTCASFKGFLDHLINTSLAAYIPYISLEVWNEPNSQAKWTGTDVEYYYLLRAAYAQEHSSVQVIMGGAARNANIHEAPWISLLYDDYNTFHCTVANPCSTRPWDVVAMHPYPNYTNDAGHPCPTVAASFVDVGTVLNTMTNNGDGLKAIWLTEFGWSSGKDYQGLDVNLNPVCSKADQVARLSGAYSYVTLPRNVTVAFWWPDDRKYLNDLGCKSAAVQPWACGEELLDANFSGSGFTANLYTAFSNVPPP